MHQFRRYATSFCLTFVLFCLGCGSSVDLVPVSGKVTIDGEPLPHGYVMMVPKDARAAGGDIGPDGRFTLKWFNEKEGCPLGTHKIAVVAVETLSPSKQRWHAPKRYRDHETSGLTATIDGPTDSLEIKLTWDGGKPFVEGTGSDGDTE